MKTIQRRLDHIEGFDLTNKEKTTLTGGVEVPCNFRCQLYNELGQPIGPQDCCPFETREECEEGLNTYYFDFGYVSYCWPAGD